MLTLFNDILTAMGLSGFFSICSSRSFLRRSNPSLALRPCSCWRTFSSSALRRMASWRWFSTSFERAAFLSSFSCCWNIVIPTAILCNWIQTFLVARVAICVTFFASGLPFLLVPSAPFKNLDAWPKKPIWDSDDTGETSEFRLVLFPGYWRMRSDTEFNLIAHLHGLCSIEDNLFKVMVCVNHLFTGTEILLFDIHILIGLPWYRLCFVGLTFLWGLAAF